MAEGSVRVDAEQLRLFAEEVMMAAGCGEYDAKVVSDLMLDASLRGVDSHGISRLGIYSERIAKGLVDGVTKIRIERETSISALVDGGNGSGGVIALKAMELAMHKAKENGIGVVGVKNSNHCGTLAYYTAKAADEGLIGFAMTNAPTTMVPWGARKPWFGTNPFSYAFPVAGDDPIVFDMATSIVARGKIILAHKNKKPIPEGWALDPDGQPTTDPAAALAGMVLPMSGPKGSGLALMVEFLSGIITGASFGPHVGPLYDNPHGKQDVGHFFLAMRPSLFIDLELYNARIKQAIAEIKALPPASGFDEVMLPGEPERRKKAERLANGIPLSLEVFEELKRIGAHYGVKRVLEQITCSKNIKN
ncbi:MAG: hypothetical protein PWR22_330 [Moorella sp. (in: firmicutes)]|uniref:Ldh family oxidoreductase n=1 Tax=Moorella sp. E306M TaxID=2572683 RepID=UPI0010FFBA2A|nr:Ldh family oxidoreductase [Moorella sp. E306M]MDK2815702.1 hypothetical protein [Moorella sp. (in: firmicutes)]GEA17447.1 hypothetical protein E306M_05810 [Moorella sp. E306M]